MEFRLGARWDEQCGIPVMKILPLFHQVEDFLKLKDYGTGVLIIHLLIDCMGYDFKEKKRFKKNLKQLNYDIMLDYFMIKNVPMDQKQGIIRRQFLEITENVFRHYKFKNFDTERFLFELKDMVSNARW